MPIPTSYPPGKQLDHYTIVRMLGQGIINRVYLARDTVNNQRVILKCPRADIIGGAAIFESIQQEEYIGTLLHHPTLQALLHHGEPRQERYLVFEYIPGRMLRSIMHEHPGSIMPAKQILPLIIPICQALVYVHEHGIIHRDIKPENILIREDGGVALLDFGISLELKQAQAKRRKLRLPFSNVIGTPAYIAPERFRGEPGNEQSDIYAMGMLLYETQCGHTAFEDADGFAMTDKQAAYDPPDIARLNPAVSPALATVIMRAIRRNPQTRYPSMQALLDDLNNLETLAVEKYVPEPPLFGGRYRQVLFVILIILVILVGIFLFGLLAQFAHK